MSLASILRSVEMLIDDVLYVSYLVPTARLRSHVPDSLKFATVEKNRVFVSVVVFRCRVSRVSLLPTPRLAFDQINVRTYVLDPCTGDCGVYFFACGVSSNSMAYLYRLVSGMPVKKIPFSLRAQRDEQTRYNYYSASGYWNGDLHIEATEVAPLVEELPPFPTTREATLYLVDQTIGFYGSPRRIRRLEVWHPHCPPRVCRLTQARFPFLTAQGMVRTSEMQQPHHVLVVPGWRFLTYLPPRRL